MAYRPMNNICHQSIGFTTVIVLLVRTGFMTFGVFSLFSAASGSMLTMEGKY